MLEGLLTCLLSPPDPPSRLGVSGRWSAFVLQPFGLLMPAHRAQGFCFGLRVGGSRAAVLGF